MCGIVGAVSNRNVVPSLVEGLSRLEYRGYDSAGVAVLSGYGIERVRAVGRVAAMQEKVIDANLSGQVGIGHTRWWCH
jgi:glutamine---fructose-6-phosphate transaminase (isomerizing)